MFILLFPITVFSQKVNPEGLKMVKEVDFFNIHPDDPTDTIMVKYCYTYSENGRMIGMDVVIYTRDFDEDKGDWTKRYDKLEASFKMKNGKIERYHSRYPWQKCEFFLDKDGNLVRWLLYSNKEPKTDCTLYDTQYIYTYNEHRGEWEIKQMIRQEAWRDKGTDEFIYPTEKIYKMVVNYTTYDGVLQHHYNYHNWTKPSFISSGIKNDLNIPIFIEGLDMGLTDWILIEHTEWFKGREEFIPQRNDNTDPYVYDFDEKGNLVKVSFGEQEGVIIKYVD